MTTVNTAVVAPIVNASVAITTRLNIGARCRRRAAYLTSCQSRVIRISFGAEGCEWYHARRRRRRSSARRRIAAVMVSAINRPHAYATPVGPSRWRSRARHSRQAASSATPGRRDPVEPRPSAGDRRVIRRLDLGDQFHVGEAAERAIEHPRPQTHAAAGALEHVVHDRQAVQVAIGKREKDLEPVRLQGNGRRELPGEGRQFIPIGIDMPLGCGARREG